MVRLETLECVLVLLDVALDLRDFLVQFLDGFLLTRLLVLQGLLLLFLLLTERLILADIVLEVGLVIFKLFGTVDK